MLLLAFSYNWYWTLCFEELKAATAKTTSATTSTARQTNSSSILRFGAKNEKLQFRTGFVVSDFQ